MSRQNSQQQLAKRSSGQQLAQRTGASQQGLSHRISQHDLVQRASQHQLVQRTQSILQRAPTDKAAKRHSADQPQQGEYWASAFDERLQGTREDRRAAPPPSTYYPPNTMRPRREFSPGSRR